MSASTSETNSIISEKQEGINEVYERFLAPPSPPEDMKRERSVHTGSLPVGELFERISASKNGSKILQLYEGDISGYPSASEADLAFINYLAWWCNYDTALVDSIYRQSALYRPKWDESRGEHTYGEMTIMTACEGKAPGDGYVPKKKKAKKARQSSGTNGANHEVPTSNPYGLKVDPERYRIDELGVFPVQEVQVGKGEWEFLPQRHKPIAGRPIWPEAIGRDVTRDLRTCVKISWHDPYNNKRSQWIPFEELNTRATLMSLDGAPVSHGRFPTLTNWLSDALGYLEQPETKVFSRPFWSDGEFIQPGHPKLEYIGPDMPTRGTVEGWAEGLTLLLELGKEGYAGLVAAGYSAISPIVQVLNKRRPIILYSYPSTSGKGTVINYATSIWEAHENRMLAAGSTWRGVQDTAIQIPDYPVFVDEVQQFLKKNPGILEDLLYFFGNGKKRSVSSPEQLARGGNPRHGVSFLAGEVPVLDNLEGGSQNRVIQIRTAPLPPDSAELAAKLERITRNNYGVVGQAIAAKLTGIDDAYIIRLEQKAARLRKYFPNLRGDDALNLTLLRYGLLLIQDVTGLELFVDRVIPWLANQVGEQRATAIDRQTACLKALLQTIYAQEWTEKTWVSKDEGMVEIPTDVLKQHGEYIAFRGSAATKGAAIEVNPNSRLAQGILKQFNLNNPGPDWANRQWIESPQAKGLTWVKKHDGVPIGRVWRFTPKALEAAGIKDE
jgi:putative DNA primase/helicase